MLDAGFEPPFTAAPPGAVTPAEPKGAEGAIMKNRKELEAFAQTDGYDTSRSKASGTGYGNYARDSTQQAWRVWRAATKTTATLVELEHAGDAKKGDSPQAASIHGWVTGYCFHAGPTCPSGWRNLPDVRPVYAAPPGAEQQAGEVT
jgi:hypothetical protein